MQDLEKADFERIDDLLLEMLAVLQGEKLFLTVVGALLVKLLQIFDNREQALKFIDDLNSCLKLEIDHRFPKQLLN